MSERIQDRAKPFTSVNELNKQGAKITLYRVMSKCTYMKVHIFHQGKLN